MADSRTERNVLSGDWKKESRKRADEAGELQAPPVQGRAAPGSDRGAREGEG